MPLTDLKCKQCKPAEKLLKLSDGGGLQLHVFPNGSKLWRGAYRYDGKQKTYSMGAYAEMGLLAARHAWQKAKATLTTGVDPTTARRVDKLRAVSAGGKSFEQVAIEWREKKYPVESKTGDDALHRLTMNIFPDLGPLPIASIDPPMVLTSLRRIEARGSLDMTKRVQRLTVRVFNYAIACGLRLDHPAAPVKEVPVTVVASLLFLAFLGGPAAKVGGASVKKGVIRVAFWSALSMGAAAGIGALFGTVV